MYIPTTTLTQGSAGSFVLLETQTIGAADDFDFLAISSDYNHLKILAQMRATSATAVNVFLRFNGDSGGNYDYQESAVFNATTSAAQATGVAQGLIAAAAGTGNSASRTGWVEVVIFNYKNTVFFKTWNALGGRSENASTEQHIKTVTGTWRNTDAVTQISIIPSVGTTFVTGSLASLYGIT